MFEKEAKDYVYDRALKDFYPDKDKINWVDYIDLLITFQDAAKFGYNKANEWHYNGVPENENDVLCQIDKDIFVVGYFHQKNKQYYSTSGEWLETVIAWKEITLPKEIE